MRKYSSRSLFAVASTAILVPLLASCDSASHSEGTIGAAVLNGQINFGPLRDSTVEVFSVSTTGLTGTKLGATKSNADGSFSIQLRTPAAGAMRVVVTSGVYTSELDGTDVGLGNCSFSYLLDGPPAAGTTVSLTPVTDLVNALTVGQLDGTTKIQDAHALASSLLAAFFGIAGNIETLLPSFDKADIGSEAFKYGLVLGALDTLSQKLAPNDRCLVMEALSQDVSDGLLDGQDHGVPVPLNGGTLPSTAGTSDFLGSLTVYANTGKQILDQGIDPASLAAAISEVKTGVADSSITPPATGISAGSSGAISTLAFDGKQWVFIAARTQGVVAIDVTDPEALAPEIKVWSHLYTTFGAEVGGVVPLVGADHPQLFVFAYQSKKAALVNAVTGVVEFEGDLAIAATAPVGFSGGSAFIAGGIPDTGRDGVWLATADGYVFWNRQTQVLETLYPVDCPHMLAENLGGDVSHGILWCPNYLDYNCGGGVTGGVQIVDLGERRSYYMDDVSYDAYFRSKGLNYCDAGSVDGSYHVGIITNEDTDDVGFVNLATISHHNETPPLLSTFTPASVDGAVHIHTAPGGGIEFSGSAVDSSTHLILFMAGYSNDIGVGQLQDPAAVPSGTWSGLVDWRYNRLGSYTYARDPHAVAAVNNLTNARSYGYLLDGSNHRALQVDLANFLGLAPDLASDGHEVSVDLVALGVIINRDW